MKDYIKEKYPNEPFEIYEPLLDHIKGLPEDEQKRLIDLFQDRVLDTRLKISYQTCLFQVIINNLESEMGNKSVYKHKIKQLCNQLINELSRFNAHYFSAIKTTEQCQSAQELINLIADNLDEAYKVSMTDNITNAINKAYDEYAKEMIDIYK